MQPEREVRYEPPSAFEVAEYAASMTGELAQMARRAGLAALASALDETQRAAQGALGNLHPGNAAPDDAA
jgi:hypothetical protein